MRFGTDRSTHNSDQSAAVNCQVSAWLICPCCTQIPGENPVSAPCCSQLYCWECLVQASQLECVCGKIVRPETCKPIDSTASRLLSEVIVPCKNESCNVSVPRKLLDQHLNSCMEALTPCPISLQCTAVLVRREVEAHCQTTCPFRTVICSLGCGQEFVLSEIQEHAIVCPAVIVECPTGCGFSSQRLSMTSHQEHTCPFSLIHCTYYNAGCNEKFLRSQLDEHLQANTRRHLDLVHEYSQAQAERISLMNNQLQLVSSQLESLQSVPTTGGGCGRNSHCLGFQQLIQNIPAISGVMEHAASLNCKQWIARAFFMVFLWWLLPTWVRFVMMFWVATHIFAKRVFPRIAHSESSVFFLNLVAFGLEFLLAVKLLG